MVDQNKPLDGLRVIDLTHVLAGPFCTYHLGLLGAEVIKVESIAGDMVRSYQGSKEQVAQKLGTGFIAQNAGKRSISIDISKPEGAEQIICLAKDADILVENHRPGALERWGLGYEALRAINPGLVYASLTAFGQNGPYGTRPGFDDVVQATSGFMALNERLEGPIHTGGSFVDYASGLQTVSAILAAMLLKQKTGEGQRVDVAMNDVSMMLINRQVCAAATTGELPPRGGHRRSTMLGRFDAKEGYVNLAGYLPHHCRALCVAMDLPQYAAFSGRDFAERGAEVDAAVEARMKERTAEQWDQIFNREGVLGGAIRDLNQVLATGQPEARELLTRVSTAAGDFQVTTSGYRINNQVFKPVSGVPLLGEHSLEILAELGLDQDQIDGLVKSGIVNTPAEKQL